MDKKYLMISAACAAILLVAGSILVYTGSEGERKGPDEGEKHVAEWTSFFWMCGDGNLGEINMMLCNLHFLEMVEDSPDVNLICILDKEGEGDTRLLEIHKGNSTQLNLTDIDPQWTDNELNLGDPEPLLKFLLWGAENYPARKYNIHLVNHGGGWRGMCWDERSNDHLSLPEIGKLCDDFKSNIGKNVDILSTEGCLVGMVEFAYEIRGSCDYFIGGSTYGWGSEAEPEKDTWEPGNWRYDRCWGALVENSNMTGEEFALTMGETFEPYGPWRAPPFIPKESNSDVMAVYNLSNVEDLVRAVDDLASELLGKVTGLGQTVNQGLLINTVIGHPETPEDMHTESFSGQLDWVGWSVYTNYDLYDFAYMLTKGTAGTLRSSKAKAVMEGVENTILLCRKDTGSDGHADAHGVSVYMPYRSSEYNSDYEKIGFARDTQWDEFIKSVHWS